MSGVSDLYREGRGRGSNPLAVQGGSPRLANDANTAGLWLFTEGAGTTTYDTKTPTKYGTLTNASMWVTGGPRNRAIAFNGSNQQIALSASWWQAPPWSIEIVGYFPGNALNAYVIDANNQPAVIHGFSSNDVELFAAVYTGDDPRVGSQIAIAAAGWYYIAYCYSDGSWRGYRNGAQIFSLAKTFTLAGSVPCVFGSAGANTNYWGGQLAEVRISSVARTAAEILTNAELMGFA